jgi:hypothetical protein
MNFTDVQYTVRNTAMTQRMFLYENGAIPMENWRLENSCVINKYLETLADRRNESHSA